MTLNELVEEVATRTMSTKVNAKDIIKEAFAVIEEQVLDHERDVAIPGFGKFSKRVVHKGQQQVGGKLFDVAGRDTLKFKSYAVKLHE